MYGSPCVFALLRQGADSALATFACYLLFASLLAQTWVVVGGTCHCGTAAAQLQGGCSSSSAKGTHMMTHRNLAASMYVCVYGRMCKRVYFRCMRANFFGASICKHCFTKTASICECFPKYDLHFGFGFWDDTRASDLQKTMRICTSKCMYVYSQRTRDVATCCNICQPLSGCCAHGD